MFKVYYLVMNLVYVNHFYYIFEELWKNGIDAKGRIGILKKALNRLA